MGRPPKYSKEFKQEAVNLIQTTNRTRGEVADSLGINRGTLGNWIRASNQTGRQAATGPLDENERNELARLRKEVKGLRQDRDILRKAAAYFATETIR